MVVELESGLTTVSVGEKQCSLKTVSGVSIDVVVTINIIVRTFLRDLKLSSIGFEMIGDSGRSEY